MLKNAETDMMFPNDHGETQNTLNEKKKKNTKMRKKTATKKRE